MIDCSTSLSGLRAAETQLSVSANNIANMQSTTSVENGKAVAKPYVPQQAVNQSQEPSGVRTTLRDVQPPSVPVFDAANPVADENGVVQYPNVNLDQEVANSLLVSNAYKANLAVLRHANESYDSLLDITG